MGFFSWFTQDTDRSISNSFSTRKPFPVYLLDDKGNEYYEPEYEGYGEFGGVDYYELMAEMNGLGDSEDPRNAGIDLAFQEDQTNVIYPNLVEKKEGWVFVPTGPDTCPDQGYFYHDYEDEDEDEDNFYDGDPDQ
jgi:hypothetical protein